MKQSNLVENVGISPLAFPICLITKQNFSFSGGGGGGDDRQPVTSDGQWRQQMQTAADDDR